MNLPKFLSQRFIFSYTIREESLGMMRYSKYIEITATKDEIKIESLPPSENAAQQLLLSISTSNGLEVSGRSPR